MAANVKAALAEIVTELGNVEGIRSLPSAPPESEDRFPFVVVYPGNGRYFKQSSGWANSFVDVKIELHVARQDLARDYVAVMDLVDAIPQQLESSLQGGSFSTISTWGDEIVWEFGPLSWAGVDTLGVTYTVENVKILETVT